MPKVTDTRVISKSIRTFDSGKSTVFGGETLSRYVLLERLNHRLPSEVREEYGNRRSYFPTKVAMTYHMDGYGQWRMSHIRISGLVYNKDGRVGRRDISEEGWHGNYPAWMKNDVAYFDPAGDYGFTAPADIIQPEEVNA